MTSTLDAYRERGLAAALAPGRRPAVVVVDLVNAFTDPESPLGSDLDSVVEANVGLLSWARSRKVPVIFTTTIYGPESVDAGVFIEKVPSLGGLASGSPGVEIDSRLERGASELILVKQYASAFFGTSLASTLTAQGVDTVIVTGATTSGCVRATVVDAIQHGFRPFVPRECVGDRSESAHAANLIDIQGKYGEVVPRAELQSLLEDAMSAGDGHANDGRGTA